MRLPSLTLNVIFVFASELVARLMAALVLVFVSRYLGPQATGIYSLGTTFLVLGGRFAAWGLEQILIRDIALDRRRVGRYAFNFLWLRFVFSIGISSAFTALVLWVLPYSAESRWPLVILLWGLIPENLTDICRAIFLAVEQGRYVLLINGLLLGFKVGGVILVILNGSSVFGIAWAVSVGGVLGSLCALALVWQHTNLRWQKPDVLFSKWAVREGVPFWAINLANTLDSQIDILLLSWFVTEAELGQYGAGLGVLLALSVLPATFRLAFFPRIMQVFTYDQTRLGKLYELSLKHLIALALPISVGLFLVSNQVILLVYHDQFIGSANVLRILSLTLIFILPGDINSRLLIASRNQKQSAVYTLAGFLINITLGIVLVPRIGIAGAALARLASNATVAAMHHSFVHRYILRTNFLKIWWRSALATGMMALAVYLIPSFPLHFLIILGALVYVVFAFLLKAVVFSEIIELVKPIRVNLDNTP